MVEEESVDAERTGASLRPAGRFFSLLVAMATIVVPVGYGGICLGVEGVEETSLLFTGCLECLDDQKENGTGKQQDDRDDDGEDDGDY